MTSLAVSWLVVVVVVVVERACMLLDGVVIMIGRRCCAYFRCMSHVPYHLHSTDSRFRYDAPDTSEGWKVHLITVKPFFIVSA
jgi:hypothetical protein